jgi:hypothetical protein
MAHAQQFVDDEPGTEDDRDFALCRECRHERPVGPGGRMVPHNRYLEWHMHGKRRGEWAGVMVRCSGSGQLAMITDD